MTEYQFEINGSSYRVKVKESRAGHAVVEVNGTDYRVDIKTSAAPLPQAARVATPLPTAPRAESAKPEASKADGIVRAPLPGVSRKLMCKPGDSVEVDAPVVVLEAMKMENEIKAPVAGTIAEFFVVEGDSVNTGDNLFRIDQ